MAQFEGEITNIFYHSKETYWTVALVRPLGEETPSYITAVGQIERPGVGLTYRFVGQHERHKKHGKQFKLTSPAALETPISEETIEKYLQAICDGIGKTLAARIVGKYGAEAINQLRDSPQQAARDVHGLSPQKAQQACNNLNAAQVSEKLTLELNELLSVAQISKNTRREIIEKWGHNAPGKIRANPYILIEFTGIGWLKADAVARNLDIPYEAPLRVRAGALYTLDQFASAGHTCAQSEKFWSETTTTLQINTGVVQDVLHPDFDKRIFVEDEGLISSGYMYDIEQWCANWLKDQPPPNITASTEITTEALTDLQKQAISTALQNRVCIITGSPGTGKTYILKYLIQYLRKQQAEFENESIYDLQQRLEYIQAIILTTKDPIEKSQCIRVQKQLSRMISAKHAGESISSFITENQTPVFANSILCCAPTGKAARRIHEETGEAALTLHSALLGTQICPFSPPHPKHLHNVDPEDRRPYYLPYGYIIVDESSMIDAKLFYALLAATGEQDKLIIVGDHYQLPSVGAGNVLRDLIQSQKIPITELTEVKRQKAGSGETSYIIQNCSRIKQGQDMIFGTEVQILNETDERKICEYTYEQLTHLASQHNLDPLRQIQVLTARRGKKTVSVNTLNVILGSMLNNNPPPFKDSPFRVGDKIIQTRNDWGNNVVNGQIGFVEDIRTYKNKGMYVFAKMDGRKDPYIVPIFENNLQLAYALTVHKFQGSECNSIIIPFYPYTFDRLLQRSWLYTAISRAKTRVILIGPEKELPRIIARVDQQQRHTRLLNNLLTST